MSDGPVDERFALELLKLLLQAVFADGHAHADEKRLVRAYAREHGLASGHLEEINRYLGGTGPLPPPNLAVLRADTPRVLRAVAAVIAADNIVATSEVTVMRELETLLRAGKRTAEADN